MNNEQYSNQRPTKSKGIYLIVILVLIVAGWYLFTNYDKEVDSNDLTYSNAFFLQNSTEKYAVFNNDGKKLTEFIYDSKSDFINNYAVVKIADRVGIISSTGKLAVDFGKYERIERKGALYKVKAENADWLLVDGKGKVIYNLSDGDVTAYIEIYNFLVLEKNKEYSLIDNSGKKLISVPVNSRANDPTVSSDEDYVLFAYGGKNFLVNTFTGKTIASFNSEIHFCLRKVNAEQNEFLLESCINNNQRESDLTFKRVKDGKVTDFGADCNRLSLEGDNVICRAKDNDYIFDENYQKGIEIYGKTYIDNNNYALDSANGVVFYENKKEVKTVPCRLVYKSTYMPENLIILKTFFSRACNTDSINYEYYTPGGIKAIPKTFKTIDAFDENGLAIVSEDGTNFYLMDKSGTQLGDSYDKVYSAYGLNENNYVGMSKNHYVVIKNEKRGIIDKEGNEIVPANYSRISVYKTRDKFFAMLTVDKSQHIFYDINNKKEIQTFEKFPSIHDNYLRVIDDGKIQFYTHTGKMFHEYNTGKE